ncbi:MAG TPA: hypothetical protein VFL57_14165 [Bryobacteraceae bacterium]|nr:hypothetical protein [Bryobacteraceae bacterium]
MAQWTCVEPSAARLAANAANAQASTGPRTPEGKARSSQNARVHGLSNREVVVAEHERELFNEFVAGYEQDLQPQGALELTLFSQIVHAAWNLRRVRVLEAALFDGSTDPLADEACDAKLDRLARYAKRFESTLLRATRELRTLQTNRAQRASVLPAVRETIPPRADTAKAVLAKRTHPAEARENDMRILLASIERETDILDANRPQHARSAA